MWRALWIICVIGADRRQLIGHLGREAEMPSMYLLRKSSRRIVERATPVSYLVYKQFKCVADIETVELTAALFRAGT
jgi:hypothetical protein